MTPPNLVSSLAVLFSISATPFTNKRSAGKRTGEQEQTYLEVSDELVDDSLSCNETFDEDIRRL
jgi:hypothetical protein